MCMSFFEQVCFKMLLEWRNSGDTDTSDNGL